MWGPEARELPGPTSRVLTCGHRHKLRCVDSVHEHSEAAFNISATIVKSLALVADFGFVADAIEGGQELYQLACSLKDETFGSAEASMSSALRNSITDELASIEDQLGRSGRDRRVLAYSSRTP